MNNRLIIMGSALGALAVILGAFSAHSLTTYLTPSELKTFHTANRYHFYHVFAIFIAAILSEKSKNSMMQFAGYAFIAGIVLFSGSLYLLATRSVLHIEEWTFLGPVTPLGGLVLILGWILILVGTFKK